MAEVRARVGESRLLETAVISIAEVKNLPQQQAVSPASSFSALSLLPLNCRRSFR